MYHSFNTSTKTIWNEWKTTMLRLDPDIQEGLLLQFHLTAKWRQEKQWHTTEQSVPNPGKDKHSRWIPCRSLSSQNHGLSQLCLHACKVEPKKQKLHPVDYCHGMPVALQVFAFFGSLLFGKFSKGDWPTLNQRDICNCSSTLSTITLLRTILQCYHSAIPNKLLSCLFHSSCHRREWILACSGVTQHCAFLGVQ